MKMISIFKIYFETEFHFHLEVGTREETLGEREPADAAGE